MGRSTIATRFLAMTFGESAGPYALTAGLVGQRLVFCAGKGASLSRGISDAWRDDAVTGFQFGSMWLAMQTSGELVPLV